VEHSLAVDRIAVARRMTKYKVAAIVHLLRQHTPANPGEQLGEEWIRRNVSPRPAPGKASK